MVYFHIRRCRGEVIDTKHPRGVYPYLHTDLPAKFHNKKPASYKSCLSLLHCGHLGA
nr:hypothetical protein [Aedes aegypti anphevirus]